MIHNILHEYFVPFLGLFLGALHFFGAVINVTSFLNDTF